MIKAALTTAILKAGWKQHPDDANQTYGMQMHHFRKDPGEFVITEFGDSPQFIVQLKAQFPYLTDLRIQIADPQNFLYVGTTGLLSAIVGAQPAERILLRYGLLLLQRGGIRLQFKKGSYDAVLIRLDRAMTDLFASSLALTANTAVSISFYPVPAMDQISKGLIRQMVKSKLAAPEVHFYRRAKVLELLSRIAKQLKGQTRLQSTGLEMKELFDNYVEERMEERFGVEEMARHFHMSISTLKQKFAKLFKSPIHQYVLQQRLERAKRLLTDRALSIYEVALLLGFTDSSHFIKQFKKRFGLTPLQYRQAQITS